MSYHDLKGQDKTVLEVVDSRRRSQEDGKEEQEDQIQSLKVGDMFGLLNVENRVSTR